MGVYMPDDGAQFPWAKQGSGSQVVGLAMVAAGAAAVISQHGHRGLESLRIQQQQFFTHHIDDLHLKTVLLFMHGLQIELSW